MTGGMRLLSGAAEPGLVGRTILARDSDIALAEPLEGEREYVDQHRDQAFDDDPDDRPVPFQVVKRLVAVLDVATGALLGTLAWRPVPHGLTLSSTAWNIGIFLLPTARGRGVGGAAGLLLTRYLFATTEIDRVQALTDVTNVPGRRGLEKAGFRREGVLRGIGRRKGQRHDEVSYSMLRSDLDESGEREILGSRDGVVLARALPGDNLEFAADHPFVPDRDPDHRLTPVSPPTVFRGVVLDQDGMSMVGVVSWHAVGYGDTLGCAAWNVGIELVAEARGRGVGTTVQRLLVEHLFATTEIDRVEATTDVDNVAERRALEKAGFQLEGVIRGAQLRGKTRRDMALYGILRTDLGATRSATPA